MSEHAQGLVLDQMEPIARGRLDLDAAVARVVDCSAAAPPTACAAAPTRPASLWPVCRPSRLPRSPPTS